MNQHDAHGILTASSTCAGCQGEKGHTVSSSAKRIHSATER